LSIFEIVVFRLLRFFNRIIFLSIIRDVSRLITNDFYLFVFRSFFKHVFLIVRVFRHSFAQSHRSFAIVVVIVCLDDAFVIVVIVVIFVQEIKVNVVIVRFLFYVFSK